MQRPFCWSNHNSLRRTNARPKGIASAITTNGTEHSSDKDWNSINFLQLTGKFCYLLLLVYYNKLGIFRQLFHKMKQKISELGVCMLRLSVQPIR